MRYFLPQGAILFMLLLLAGCSKDDAVNNSDAPVNKPASDEISFKIDTEQVVEGRSRATTFDNLVALKEERSFKCTAYDHNTTTANATVNINNNTVTWGGSSWNFEEGKRYWPKDEDATLDFFAYMPATVPAYITGPTYAVSAAPAPYFTCDMTKTIEKEFIWALATGKTKENASSGVALTFYHPFARIKFKLSDASGNNVKINSISLPAIDMTGTCTFDGTTSTWSGLGGAASFSANALNTSYLVIPNDYGTKTLTVNATWSSLSNVTKDVSANVDINWAVGTSYTYILTLSEYALKVDTDKYTEQW